MAVPPNLTTHVETALAARQRGDAAAEQRALAAAAALLLKQAAAAPPGPLRSQAFARGERLRAQAESLAPQVAAQKSARAASEQEARRLAPALAEADEVPPWLLADRPRERLADVAGLDEAKEQIHLKIIYPFSHPEAAAHYGVSPGGGVLLYGPPGTGKTYFARAVAGEVEAAFFAAKGSTIMSQWVGKAEQNVAALFDAARRYPKAIVFLDELDALLPVRGATSSSVVPRVVDEFLAQMDGLQKSRDTALMVLGATNLPWAVDPAALRPGRFDALIYVGLPNEQARRRLLELHTAGRPLDPALDLDALARRTEGFSGADMADLCLRAAQRAFLEEVLNGTRRTIAAGDFEAALEGRTPSVKPEALRRLDKFRAAQAQAT